MNATCPLGFGTCWMTTLFYLGWWLLTSALVWVTWNQVVVSLTKAKHAKFWQVLLLITTLWVLGAPRMMMRHHGGCDHHRMEGRGSTEQSKQ